MLYTDYRGEFFVTIPSGCRENGKQILFQGYFLPHPLDWENSCMTRNAIPEVRQSHIKSLSAFFDTVRDRAWFAIDH